jgi:transposase
MTFFAGVDLGKRKSHIRVITQGREVVEDLKIENDPKAFARIFRKYKGDIEVACEASSNAFWVADTLMPMVKKVHVGDTKKIKWISEARIKTDRIDAGILAELLRADLFPTIWIPPKRVRELRELVRGLIRMRRAGTRQRNQVHGLLGRHGVPYKRSETRGSKLAEMVSDVDLCPPAHAAAKSFLRMEAAALKEEKYLEGMITKELEGEPEICRLGELLHSIPGLGDFSATLWIVELWEIARFRDAAHLASYIGFVPGTHQTGETLWHGKMTRQGNPLLRWILVQNAWAAVRTNLFFARLYERQKARIGGSRAIVPVARALLKTIHRVWTEGKPYDEVYAKKALVG